MIGEHLDSNERRNCNQRADYPPQPTQEYDRQENHDGFSRVYVFVEVVNGTAACW